MSNTQPRGDSPRVNVVIKPGGLLVLSVVITLSVVAIAAVLAAVKRTPVVETVTLPRAPGAPAPGGSRALPLLSNGSFEIAGGGGVLPALEWQGAVEGSYFLDDRVAHSGKHSIRLTNDGPAKGQCTARQAYYLYQKTAQPVEFSAWSKAEGVTGQSNEDYALYIDVEYADGTFEWGHSVPFSVGTHDWEQKKLTILPKKPIRHCKVFLLFRRKNVGTVWFDDVECRAL